MGGGGDLAVVRPGRVDSWIERLERAAEPIDRQRRGNVGGGREARGAGARQCGDRGGRLGTVDQREPFFRLERHRCDAGLAEGIGAGHERGAVADRRLSFADEDECQVRERREVAAGADGPA